MGDDLQQRLVMWALMTDSNPAFAGIADDLVEAADLIKEQQNQIVRLRNAAEHLGKALVHCADVSSEQIETLRAQLEEARRG